MNIAVATGLITSMVLVAVAPLSWQPQTANTSADFRGLSVVNAKVAWASGTKGTFAHTGDGGEHWTVGQVPGTEKLDFRDVEGFGEDTAYLMSAGPGEASRVYKTIDGGRNWKLQFQATTPKSFLDAMAFWDPTHGITIGDSVDGRFQLFSTDDGEHWRPMNGPDALDNEGLFAASGTCLVTHGTSDAWFVTGGAKVARILRTNDRGQSWTATVTPLSAGVETAGIFSIAFRDRNHGMIVGGDYKKPNDRGNNAAVTADGGQTWTLTKARLPYQSAVAWAGDRWLTVGTVGSYFSVDNGATWVEIDRENFNAVATAAGGAGWRVGPKGRVARFVP